MKEPRLFTHATASAAQDGAAGEVRREFRREFDRAFEEAFARQHQAVRLTRANASGLVEAVESLSKKAGLPHVPGLYLAQKMPTPVGFPNAMAVPLPEALASSSICVNRELLAALGHADLHAQPAAELSAVLAHELGHLKQGYAGITATRLPLVAMPLLAVGALSLYDRSRRRMEKAGQDPQDAGAYLQALDQTAAEAKSSRATAPLFDAPAGDQVTMTAPRSLRHQCIDAARYVAAGVAGVEAGGIVTHYRVLGLENDADRTAVKLTGSAEPLISALTKMQGHWDKAVRANPSIMPQAAEGIQGRLNEMAEKFKRLTIYAHPPLTERAAAARSFEARLKAGAEAAASHLHL